MGRHCLTGAAALREAGMNPAVPDLAAVDAVAAWEWLARELSAAVASARHPFHLLTVATVGGDGHPGLRTVVLRHVDPLRREIRFHTDARSPKLAAILVEPRVALHWYDSEMRLQVRIAAHANVHHADAVAAAAWAAAPAMSRACYTSASAPGAPLSSFPEAPEPSAANDDAGLAHFAVVSCHFTEAELLALDCKGHRRVRLHLDREPIARTILAP